MTTTKRRALSPILAVMLLLGLTVVGAGTAAVLFSDVSDNALSVSAVEINDARAYNTGDQAYMSLGVKNTGTNAAEDLKVSVLLECNGGSGAGSGYETCSTAKLGKGLGPGGFKSEDVGTITDLAPGQSASVSGIIQISNGTGTAPAPVRMSAGEQYVIQVEGRTSSDEVIVQTATVRVR